MQRDRPVTIGGWVPERERARATYTHTHAHTHTHTHTHTEGGREGWEEIHNDSE